MQKPLLIFFLVLATLASSWTHAAGASASTVRAETEALLARLAASGCQFNRNGTWYGGQEAKAHLADKLKYIEGKTQLNSTEQFIELGASKSSMSGKPYLVRCGNEAPVPSASWLLLELKAIRAKAGTASLPPAK